MRRDAPRTARADPAARRKPGPRPGGGARPVPGRRPRGGGRRPPDLRRSRRDARTARDQAGGVRPRGLLPAPGADRSVPRGGSPLLGAQHRGGGSAPDRSRGRAGRRPVAGRPRVFRGALRTAKRQFPPVRRARRPVRLRLPDPPEARRGRTAVPRGVDGHPRRRGRVDGLHREAPRRCGKTAETHVDARFRRSRHRVIEDQGRRDRRRPPGPRTRRPEIRDRLFRHRGGLPRRIAGDGRIPPRRDRERHFDRVRPGQRRLRHHAEQDRDRLPLPMGPRPFPRGDHHHRHRRPGQQGHQARRGRAPRRVSR